MKKTLSKLSKVFSILFFVITTFFGTTIDTWAAAPNSIKLGESKDIPGYVAGTYFSTKTIEGGGYAYCLNINLHTARNTTAYLAGGLDAGFAYIMENGYPAKSITGNSDYDYYITQTAVWWYLDETTGSSNLLTSFKTTGSDPHNLRPHIKKLVEGAKTARKNGYAKPSLKLSVENNKMTLDSNKKYYVSEAISATTSSITGKYTVAINDAPTGTLITDVNGTSKTSFATNEKFKVKVPVSTLTSTNVSVKVTANATGSVNKAYEYRPKDSGMQNVVPAVLTPETSNVSSSINLEISTSKVKIIKIDADTKNPLAGAKLQLTDEDGKVITTWTSSTKAHVINNLPVGTYYLKEVEAPKGYKLNKTPIEVKVTEKNKDFTVTMSNKAKQVVVNIVKIDKETEEAIAGATLVVRNEKGEEVARFTSTLEPYVLTDLEDGTYTVEEVEAPSGYVLNTNKITFTIDDEHEPHQIMFENTKEVVVPDTASSGIIFYILGTLVTISAIGFVYYNGNKAKQQ